MATSAVLRKGAKEVNRLQGRIDNDRKRKTQTKKDLREGVGSIIGGIAAAMIDSKFGGGGMPATLPNTSIPTNAAIGLATAVLAATIRMPMRREIGAAGIGMTTVSAYTMTLFAVQPSA